ncbi:hypothetical protein JZ751_006715 [Albula glossodonta]|uniref:Uncharacterized protein n=1 Tax=Albula glossodonta TaxID=121402 RepID=A0A8T2P1U1_9TELE|nr:hypothetical protein JZ751_006715 [Albula glossodonta]
MATAEQDMSTCPPCPTAKCHSPCCWQNDLRQLHNAYAFPYTYRGNTSVFTGEMKELMSCPWEVDRKRNNYYRAELHSMCNATGKLILTRQNTVLGQRIKYDGDRSTKVVDKSLLNMLPESMPWKTKGLYRSCSVVGNGGILKNSSCGSKIDAADFVIRLNLAPITVKKDVGVKTNLITANPTQIRRSYPNMKTHGKRLAYRLSLYKHAPLLLPAFAFRMCTSISYRVHQGLHALVPEQKVVFFNPHYLRMLDRYWRKKGQRASRLSTGLMLASVAIELCDEVNLYGFWPFSFGLSGHKLTHHYYDNVGPRHGAHCMPKEFQELLKMHSQGALNLHIGKCQ